MTILGFIPNKNSVEVRQSGADVATMPVATPKAAGAMSADQAQMLRELYERVFEAGQAVTALIPQLPADMSAYVTRDEVQQVLARLPTLQMSAASSEPVDITPRVRALEGAVKQMRQIKPAVAPNDLSTRLTIIEARVAQWENGLIELAETVGSIEEMLRGLHELVSDDTEQLRIMP